MSKFLNIDYKLKLNRSLQNLYHADIALCKLVPHHLTKIWPYPARWVSSDLLISGKVKIGSINVNTPIGFGNTCKSRLFAE